MTEEKIARLHWLRLLLNSRYGINPIEVPNTPEGTNVYNELSQEYYSLLKEYKESKNE